MAEKKQFYGAPHIDDFSKGRDDMYLTFGILAHVDAGKTTLSEQILYKTSVIRSAGRVDHRNTLLDNTDIERRRGITVFSEQASFEKDGNTFFLVDTPGHIDFSPEMERSLSILDAAVIVVSAVSGIQSHTETIWRLVRKYSIPTMFFINKTDLAGADKEKVYGDIRRKFSGDAVMISDEHRTELLDKSLEASDELLEKYLDSKLTDEEEQKAYKKAFSECKVFPVLCGSALEGEGVSELIDELCRLSYKEYDENSDASACVYKVKYDNKRTRLTYMKILSGAVGVKDMLGGEKIDQLYKVSGGKLRPTSRAAAGELVAAVGLSAKSGQIIGSGSRTITKNIVPVMTAKVEYDEKQGFSETFECFKLLEDEQPEISLEYDTSLKELRISYLGDVQLEVLREEIKDRFGLEVGFSDSRVMYKETIKGASVGYGHFEPLRHYAEVHVRLNELPRGSGIVFDSECSTDFLSKNWQNLIMTHVFEKQHLGDLTGSPLTDVKVTLLTGRAHLKHTEGGDFREATYRAVRNAVFRADTVLLEPLYNFEIEVENSLVGRVISDIIRMSGETESPQTLGETSVVRGICSVSELNGYYKELLSFSKGRAIVSYSFAGYGKCHNSDAVIEAIGYDRERDVENTADSVFCSHGAGFPVKWYDAEKYMHLLK